MATLQEFFLYEGEEHRIQGGVDNSGVRAAGKPHYRKWTLCHRISRRWVEDAYVLLPNEDDVGQARERFGFQ